MTLKKILHRVVNLIFYGKCGTVVPIWMNGSHPTAQDGIVQRQLCANLGTTDTCCETSLNIDVKNCGNYYVYNLYPTPFCPAAHCTGKVVS